MGREVSATLQVLDGISISAIINLLTPKYQRHQTDLMVYRSRFFLFRNPGLYVVYMYKCCLYVNLFICTVFIYNSYNKDLF